MIQGCLEAKDSLVCQECQAKKAQLGTKEMLEIMDHK